MKKIKVLFAIPNLKTAGSGREMLNIVESLDKNIFEAWVGVQEIGGELFDEVIAKRIPVVVQPFIPAERLNWVAKVQRAKTYARDFKKLDFDIWQSFNWSSDFSEAIVARKAGAKYVYVKKNMNWGRKAWTVKSLLASAIIARNATMLETFFAVKKYKRKTHLIPGGVDTRKFLPQPSNDIRKEYNIPEDAFLLSCVAQLVRSKDQATLIKAAASVKNVHVLLAGGTLDDDYRKELERLAGQKETGSLVTFAGPVKDIPALLNSSNAFVLPTSIHAGHEEGCPVALLEAMACKLPCIASDVAGSRDIVEQGKTGLLFKPGNVAQLADRIRELMEKPPYAKELAESAFRHVQTNYTLEKEAHAFAALYKKLVS